jgi:homoserine dehydrogenase
MRDNGETYEDALKQAQANGYAEQNPTADVDGIDAQRKLSILSSIALDGSYVSPSEIHTVGISGLSLDDIGFAGKIGCKVKLLAALDNQSEGKAYSFVAPHFVRSTSVLYPVEGVFNAVVVEGNALGEAMFYGQGAGSLPTASAVVGDVVELAKNKGKVLPFGWSADKLMLSDVNEYETAFYVRVNSGDASAFKNSFADVKCIEAPEITGEVAFITEKMSKTVLTARLRDIEPLQILRVN